MSAPAPGEDTDPGVEAADSEEDGDAAAEFDDVRTAVTKRRKLTEDQIRELRFREKVRRHFERTDGDNDED